MTLVLYLSAVHLSTTVLLCAGKGDGEHSDADMEDAEEEDEEEEESDKEMDDKDTSVDERFRHEVKMALGSAAVNSDDEVS